jgi:mannan endo-1,4-beta-mannosidase
MSLALMFLLLQTAVATFLQARASNSFAGSNNYYLHGLLPQEQADYIQALQADGAKIVRLWGGPDFN